jgi:hypothetical protein
MAHGPLDRPNYRLRNFAQRLAALDEAAWSRIRARCALLDRDLIGLLGRAELFARSVLPDSDPYSLPLYRPTTAALGAAFGLLGEIGLLLGGPDPDGFQRTAVRLLQDHADSPREVNQAAFLTVLAAAARNRRDHAGTAAALQAIAFSLLSGARAPADVAAVYGPFEAEIPFASLDTGPDQHAA